MAFAAGRHLTVTVALCALAAAGAPAAQAAPRQCERIDNPYPGTRYEGVDIKRIRAVDVTCARARRVARGAHRKGLGLTPPPSGVRRYRWRGWKVTGDLRGDNDRYVARRGGKRVRWVF
jgi:hypothetical protein